MIAPGSVRELLLAVALGAVGAAINLLPLPLGAGVDLVLGNFAYLLVAAWLRPAFAVAAALACTAPLWLQWGHPGGVVVFTAEALCVALLCGRGRQLFFADMLFWALLGMPLTAVMVALVGSAPVDYLLSICVKQGVNGVVYGSFAGLVALVAGRRVRAWLAHPPAPRPALRSRMVYVMTLITAFPLATATLLSTRTTVRYQEALVRASLAETATHLARRVDDHLRSHAQGVDLLAELLTRSSDRTALAQAMLVEEHRRYPGFLSMLIADASGAIIATAPADRMDTVAAGIYPSVGDRPYFIEAMERDQVYVSEVFRGRGFGTEPIVAISRAVREGSGGRPVGIVEGSLDLRGLADIAEPRIPGRALQVVLVDHAGRLIHASPALGFTAMEPLERYRSAREPELRDVLAFEVGERSVEYLYSSVELAKGWRITALMEYGAVIRQLNLQYGSTFLLIGLAILLSALLAEQAGQRLAAPLERLARDLAAVKESGVARIGAAGPDASREIALVHEELGRSFAEIERHRNELSAEVAARTEELEEANNLLQALASVDALTGIGNRRVIEERFPLLRAGARRSGAHVAVILTDLDHFKKLNDLHGHLAGDQCLIEVALLLQAEFGRQTDIVARFGGEEFVIAVDCRDAEALARKLESVRQRVESLRIGAGTATPLRVTASFGALVAGAEYSAQLQEWMRVADQCLYRAKEKGRNCVVIESVS